jgi:hypothetical protein
MISGRYYGGESILPQGSFSSSALTVTAGRLYGTPFYVPRTQAFDRIGIYVNTTAAGKAGRCLVYAIGSDGLPGSLVFDPGANLNAGVFGANEHTIALTLPGDTWYLTAFWSDGAPVVGGFSPGPAFFGLGTLNESGRAASVYVDVAGGFGSAPATFGAPTYNTGAQPRIVLRAA